MTRKTIYQIEQKLIEVANHTACLQLKRGTAKIFFLACGCLVSALLTTSCLASNVDAAKVAHVYVLSDSPNTDVLVNYFKDKPDWRSDIYSLNDSTYLTKFLNIAEKLETKGIEVLSPGTCLPCELQRLSWTELLVKYVSPLILFFHDDTPSAITIGVTNQMVLDQALGWSSNNVKVFTPYNSYTLSYPDVQSLESLLEPYERENLGTNMMAYVLPAMILGVTLTFVGLANAEARNAEKEHMRISIPSCDRLLSDTCSFEIS